MYSNSEAINPARYFFVSCWTKEAKESIPMWSQYADNMCGVRIGLDEDMFVTCEINERFRSFFNDVFNPIDGYVKAFINNASLIDVVYLQHPELARRKCVRQEGNGIYVDHVHLGQYKSKSWEFQKECRFKLWLLPIDKDSLVKQEPKSAFEYLSSMIENVNNAVFQGIQLPVEHFDVPLQPRVLDRIEVRLGPKTSKDDEERVREILRDFQKPSISKSSLPIR